VISRATRGTGCPVCSGLQPGPLSITHPHLLAELDPTRNGGVTGETVHAGSHGLLRWRCPAGHGWQDSPARRAQGAGCPTCHAPDAGGRSGRRLRTWS
jgi:hypothetical protein